MVTYLSLHSSIGEIGSLCIKDSGARSDCQGRMKYPLQGAITNGTANFRFLEMREAKVSIYSKQSDRTLGHQGNEH